MPPGEHGVEILERRIQAVIALRTNGHEGGRTQRADVGGQYADAFIGQGLAIPHSQVAELCFLVWSNVCPGDDQRAEIITLAGFINPNRTSCSHAASGERNAVSGRCCSSRMMTELPWTATRPAAKSLMAAG